MYLNFIQLISGISKHRDNTGIVGALEPHLL